MLKFNVKSLILAFCVLGGMVTAGVASAIPERYIMTGGNLSGYAHGQGNFFPRTFELTLDIDSDLLADPRTFEAFLEVEGVGGRQWAYQGEGQGPFQFEVSRSIYTEPGMGFISKLVVKAFSESAYGDLDLNVRLLPDGGVWGSDFSFTAAGFGHGQGDINTLTKVALPTPSSVFLMLPLLLFVFRRSLLNMFNTFKPVRALAA